MSAIGEMAMAGGGQAVGRTGETRLGRLTAVVALGYFFVWTAFGAVVLIAGIRQFSAWKARHLACGREAPRRGRMLPGDAGTAWRHGLHCGHCCAGLVAVLLVVGVMDLRAMAAGSRHHRRASRPGR